MVGVQVRTLATGETVAVAGSAEGCLCRLRMQVPGVPGALPSAIQLQGGQDFEEACLTPWLSPHTGPVSGLDLTPDASEVACPSFSLIPSCLRFP